MHAEDERAHRRFDLDQVAQQIEPAQPRQVDVDDGDRRPLRCEDGHGLDAVGGLDQLDIGRRLQEPAQAGADHGVVVDDQHFHAGARAVSAMPPSTGRVAVTVKPPPGSDAVSSRPPAASTRSCMPVSPKPGFGPAAPLPSSLISTENSRPYRKEIRIRVGSPCRSALLSASWTMRKTATSANSPKVSNSSPTARVKVTPGWRRRQNTTRF